MITKYDTYIKESINDINDLVFIINKIINKINNDLQFKWFNNIDRFSYNHLTIYDKYNEVILKIELYNKIILKFKYPLNNNGLISELILDYNNKDLESIFYDKILLCNFMIMICRNLNLSMINHYKYDLTIHKNIDNIIKFLKDENFDLLLKILNNNRLPNSILIKYKYLIDANNFNLI